MRVYSGSASDAPELARRLPASLLVIGLCAQWCGTCRDFLPMFERLAASRPEAVFVWLDIEDDSALAGDVDVENFPTLAVFRDSVPVHFGISLPQQGVVARLLGALESGAPRGVEVPKEVAQLPQLIAAHARQEQAAS
jgi:thioredoxin 1